MVVGVGLIGTVSATVAAWFVSGNSEPGTDPADVDAERTLRPAPATTADSQAPLLDRLDELAAKQDEIRAMLIEPAARTADRGLEQNRCWAVAAPLCLAADCKRCV